MNLPVRSVQRMRRRASRALLRGGALALVAPFLVAAVARFAGWDSVAPIAVVAFPISLLVAPLAWLAAVAVSSRFERWARADTSGGDLTLVDGRAARRFAGASLEGGLLLPSGDAAVVEIYLRGGDAIALAFDDEEDARRLLAELQLGQRDRRVQVSLGDTYDRARATIQRTAICVAAGFLALGGVAEVVRARWGVPLPTWSWGAWLLFVAAAVALWQRARRPLEIVLGADGLEVLRPWSRDRVRLDDLADLSMARGTLTLHLADGRSIPVDTGSADPRLAEGIACRIGEAIRDLREPTPLASRFDRGARTLEEWRRELAKVLQPGASYRHPPIDPEVALALVTDARASSSERIGAALALVESGGAEARERVRGAAERVTDEPLRRALRHAAGGELTERDYRAATASR